MIKNNNLTKYVLLVLSKFESLCVCKKKKKKGKKGNSFGLKKIAKKITASFLIKFCRGN